MTRRMLSIASLLTILAMLAVALIVGTQLADDVRLPIHWNAAGEVDGYASKWPALLLPAAITGALSLLFFFLPILEPRREGLERSQGLYLWGWASLLLIGAALQFVIVATAFDWAVPADRVIVAAIGLMLVVIGNQLGKSRSMYLIGLRTPWTLASEEVWVRTHRLGGKLMVTAGMVIALAAVPSLAPGMLMGVVVVAVTIAALVPIVYSYLIWRREQDSDQPSG
jgi:uncharacterized membrane protein